MACQSTTARCAPGPSAAASKTVDHQESAQGAETSYAFMGLLPIMWSTSAGADVMKRIAAPMIGGPATSFLLELLVYPAIYKLWKGRAWRRSRSEA